MFVGHYGPSFGIKSIQRSIPLWLLFVAVQLLDVGWSVLVFFGVEKVRIVPGITASNPLDLYYMPYTHSLVAAFAWGVAGIILCRLLLGIRDWSASIWIGAAVFSHWVLDLIAHPRDLAIYDNTWKVGFGLWNYRDAEFALEIALLAVAIMLYVARNAMPAIRKGAVIAFGVVLVVIQIGDTYVPRNPLTDKETVMGVWIFNTLFVIVAFLIEKIGSRQHNNPP